MGNNEIIDKVRHSTYQMAENELSGIDDQELIHLVNHKMVKIGDVAIAVLSRRGKLDMIVDSINNGIISTKKGKIRAANIMCWYGKKYKRSPEVWLKLIKEKDSEVLSCALFGLVLLQEKNYLPEIIKEINSRKDSDKGLHWLRVAKEAIETGNPFVYAPYYRDSQGIWDLDPVRFPYGGPP